MSFVGHIWLMCFVVLPQLGHGCNRTTLYHQPFSPHRQQRCQDDGTNEKTDQAEGVQAAKDSDQREQKWKPRCAADERWL